MEAVRVQNHHGGSQPTSPTPNTDGCSEHAPGCQPPSLLQAHACSTYSHCSSLISQDFNLPTRRNIYIFNLENISAKTCPISSSIPALTLPVEKREELCGIIVNGWFWKTNCINDIKYLYRLNTSPVLSRKLTYTLNQRIKFLEIYR